MRINVLYEVYVCVSAVTNKSAKSLVPETLYNIVVSDYTTCSDISKSRLLCVHTAGNTLGGQLVVNNNVA